VPGKQRIVLLVLVLFGLPAIVTTALLFTNVKVSVQDGPQPGGVVRGTVHDEEGKALAGIEVGAFAVSAKGLKAPLETTKTDASGAYQVTLPPFDGHYELSFVGPEWVELRVDHSFLDATGKAVEPGPMDVRLRAGSSLDVEVRRPGGQVAGRGSYELEGAPGGSFFAAWSGVRVARTGTFESGSFRIEGLPSMPARLLIRMDTGERTDSTLELTPGKNRHTVQL
jgi:hypothetical protein